MNRFYMMGKTAALQKLGQGGLGAAWKALGGAGQGAVKRVGVGMAGGGLAGGLAGGDMQSALLGAGLGGAGMGAAGHLMGRAAQRNLRGDLRATVKGMTKKERGAMNREGMRENYQQMSDQVQSQILPRYNRQIATPMRGDQLGLPGLG